MEQWKKIKIKGCEQYEVSNLGRVKNLDGSIKKPYWNKHQKRNIYAIYNRKLHKHIEMRGDKLVLMMFKPNPNEYKYKKISHIDGNFANDRLDNLEWVTTSDYYDRHVRYNKKGTNLKRSYKDLTEEEVKYIRDNYIHNDPEFGAMAIGDRLGINRNRVKDIALGKCRKDIV